LLFLDIQMPELNGFDAAKIIRTEYQDWQTLIVFVTITDEYLANGYGVEALDYKQKPIKEDELHELLNRALSKTERRTVTFDTAEGTYCCKTSEIFYVESTYGSVTVHTVQKKLKTKITLETVARRLPERIFVQAHRSYYINLEHVHHYDRTNILLRNAVRIPLSRKHRREFIGSLKNYVREA
jgi:DNA-binding LytR/AlgR family response regulator